MPGSLRARILASHLVVIALMVGLTVVIGIIPARRAQERLAVQRLEDIARPLLAQAGVVLNRPAIPDDVLQELLAAQARQIDARIVLLDSTGEPIADSSGQGALSAGVARAVADKLPEVLASEGSSARRPAIAAQQVPMRDLGAHDGYRVIIGPIPGPSESAVAILAPSPRLPLGRTLGLPLLIASGIGLLGAVVATILLSTSISQPISRLTRAADAVAAGDLEHRIAGEGNDEVGRLVRSFNTMVGRLKATSDSQRRMLANVAHEIRTPLTSIQGYAQGLIDGVFGEPEAQRTALTAIAEESERLNGLVVQILQLARLESGETTVRRVPVRIDQTIDRVLHRYQREAAANQIALIHERAPLPEISADPALLEQAIDNLIRNALRHTPSGGRITVQTAESTVGGTRLPAARISVSDTGSGIAPDDIPYVFDRFYRASAERTAASDRDEGFGLGLAIVREIATSHGGRVSVESRPGHGATFVVELPLGAGNAPGRRKETG